MDPKHPEGRHRPDRARHLGGDKVQRARAGACAGAVAVVPQGDVVEGDGGARRADGEARDRPLHRDQDQEDDVAWPLAVETSEPHQTHKPLYDPADQRAAHQADIMIKKS